jgi:predicted RNA binding protein YcfA (HicA-like mRNA interferase family)
LKVKDVVKEIEGDGWIYRRTKGDHHVYSKDGSPENLAIAGKPSDEVSPGVLSQIRRITGLRLR